jgi:hypothetical protein
MSVAMAFTPNDSTSLAPLLDVTVDNLQHNAHQYQVGARDNGNPASAGENTEKYLQPMHLDDQQGQAKMREMVQAKEKALEAKYPGITFAQDGDKLGYQHKIGQDGNAVPTQEPVTAREPSLKELAGVEAALATSDPSYKSTDGQPLHIQFPDKPMFKIDGQTGDYASFSPPDPEKPGTPSTMNIDMRAGDHQAATEKDVTDRGGDRNSVESVVTHELAHATQYHVNGLDQHATYKTEAGWVPLKKHPAGRNDYALQGSDGKLYQPIPGSGGQIDWAKLEPNAGFDRNGDYKGAYIKDTKLVQGLDSPEAILAHADHVTNLEMMKLAEVTPTTRYFKDPEEMMAEGLTDYRMNETSRAQLKHDSPKMYEAAKHLDQLELDTIYGVGKKTRLKDGTIGDASSPDII